MGETTEQKNSGGAKNGAGGNRQPSGESVAARAARMAKRELQERARSWAAQLGLKADTPEEFEAELQRLKAEKERTLPENEKLQARVAELEGQVKKLTDENTRVRAAYNRSEKERKAMVAKQEAQRIESEIQAAAGGSGFKDPKYALHLFREHVVNGGQHAEDPKAFFDSLKGSAEHKHLFREEVVAAGPQASRKPEGETTASSEGGGGEGSESRATDLPDQGAPAPARPGKVKPTDGVEDVGKLDKRTFADRTADRYGFRPGR